MPLEVSCPSCSGQFRVPDSAAGKKIRCPKCKGAMDVPAAVPASPAEAPEFVPPPIEPRSPPVSASKPAPPKPKPPAPAPAPPKVQQWFLKTEEGEDYGPIPRDELDAWRTEGRITADCQLLREGTDQWQWAGDVYSELNEDGQLPPAKPTAAIAPQSKQKSAPKPRQEPADTGPPSTRSRIVRASLNRGSASEYCPSKRDTSPHVSRQSAYSALSSSCLS